MPTQIARQAAILVPFDSFVHRVVISRGHSRWPSSSQQLEFPFSSPAPGRSDSRWRSSSPIAASVVWSSNKPTAVSIFQPPISPIRAPANICAAGVSPIKCASIRLSDRLPEKLSLRHAHDWLGNRPLQPSGKWRSGIRARRTAPKAGCGFPSHISIPCCTNTSRSLPGVELRYNMAFESFRARRSKSILQHYRCKNAAGKNASRPDYLVGCDGGRSNIRRALGIQYEGVFAQGMNVAVLFRSPSSQAYTPWPGGAVSDHQFSDQRRHRSRRRQRAMAFEHTQCERRTARISECAGKAARRTWRPCPIRLTCRTALDWALCRGTAISTRSRLSRRRRGPS